MTTAKKSIWKFEKVGLSYRLYAEDAGIELIIGRLKRSGQELQGELRIVVNWEGIKTVDGTLHQARFNVSSVAARASLTKHLKSRTDKTDFSEMDWADALEHLCQRVMEAERQGEPLVSMNGEMPSHSRQKYDITRLCPHGVVTWIYGPGGMGKSIIGIGIACSVSKGMEIIPGLAPQIKGAVLYLDYETDQWKVRERTEYIANGHDFKPTKDFYYRRCYRPVADDVEEISRLVAEHDIKFIIIDSAGPAIGSHGDYGDANESVLKLFSAIRAIGVTTIVIDHVSKQELMRDRKGKVVGALPYGSIYKINLSRSAWEIQNGTSPDDTDMHVRLVNVKNNDAKTGEPIDLSIHWDSEEGVIIFDKDDEFTPEAYIELPPDPKSDVPLKNRMIDALSGKPDGLTRDQIQNIVKHPSAAYVRKLLLQHSDTFQKIYDPNESATPRYRLVKKGGI